MLEEFSNNLSESGIEYCEESEDSYYDSKSIIRGIAHSFLIPFVLGYFFGVIFAWTYLASLTILYLTAFRNKPSKNAFFVVIFVYVCIAMMIVPFVYHA